MNFHDIKICWRKIQCAYHRRKIFFTAIIPAAAAQNPPTLLVITYDAALAISPRPIMLTTSTEKVEKVVKDPQKPTPRSSFILGDSPEMPLAVAVFVLAAAVAVVSTSGEPYTPPNMNEPSTLIPAVCQPGGIKGG